VRLEYRATTVQLEVTDDGVGFDAQREVSVESRHFGLIGMRERAETAGGSFQVTSSPGAGAKVIATLPKVPRSRAAEL
jgi:signal transduction histidine kinase